jgi:hypothetical protein
MKWKLNANEVEMVSALAKELRSESDEELSLKENMKLSFQTRVENADCEKEVEAIIDGISKFDDLLEKTEEQELRDLIIQTLDESSLKDFSVENQYRILAEILEACRKEMLDIWDYDIDEWDELSIKKEGEITEDDLTEMKALVAEYLDEFSILNMEGEAARKFYKIAGPENLEKFEALFKDDTERYYVALAARILQMQGKLQSISAHMGAHEISVSVASVFASAKVKIQGLLGKIPKEKVVAALKKIAGVAMLLLVCVAVTAAACGIADFVFHQTTVLLGAGTVGLLVSCVAAVLCGVGVVDILYKATDKITEDVKNAGEFVNEKSEDFVEWIRSTVIPEAKDFMEKAKQKITFMNGKPEDMQETDEQEAANDDEDEIEKETEEEIEEETKEETEEDVEEPEEDLQDTVFA